MPNFYLQAGFIFKINKYCWKVNGIYYQKSQCIDINSLVASNKNGIFPRQLGSIEYVARPSLLVFYESVLDHQAQLNCVSKPSLLVYCDVSNSPQVNCMEIYIEVHFFWSCT